MNNNSNNSISIKEEFIKEIDFKTLSENQRNEIIKKFIDKMDFENINRKEYNNKIIDIQHYIDTDIKKKKENQYNKELLINDLDLSTLTEEQKNNIMNNIKNLDFNNLNKKTYDELLYTYKLETKLLIQDNIEKFKNNLRGFRNKKINDDDLIILVLAIGLIGVIIYKFKEFSLGIIMFLIKKIILPNIIIILIILITILIYNYKRKVIYDLYDFLLIWFKIFTFQWLM
jgi:hypothetical protein